MTAAQEKRELSKEFEGDLISLGATESVTFYMGNGTDTDTARYLNLETGLSHGIEIVPTVACSITKVNGKNLKAAQSIGTLGWRMSTGVFQSVTIQAGTATVVEIFAKS